VVESLNENFTFLTVFFGKLISLPIITKIIFFQKTLESVVNKGLAGF